jgi:hypothetical protein
VGAQHSQFAAGQGGEFGQLHCKFGHVVPIETKSPVAVSRKWEYSGVRPETFGVFALKG